VGPNFTELWISLDPSVDYEATVEEIQTVVDGYPGLYRDLLTYLRERIKEVLTGVSATLVVRIYGPDLDRLEVTAHEVERAIADVEGVVDLHVQPQVRVPQIEVRFRPEVAEQFGLTPGHVQRALATLVKGTKVSEFYEGQGVFDITVWGVERVRSDPGGLQRIMIDAPSGGQVPLGDVADVRIVGMRNEITREEASRKIDVTCNVVGRDLGSVARDIEARVQALDFEAAYHPEVIGEYAEQEATRNRLLGLALLSLVAIFLILQADYGSARLALLVLLTVPFAAVGGLLAVILTGATLSLGSLVGFVTVLGIAVRNSIMLISHYRHLEVEEGVPFGPSLVLQGSEERLAPILMTSLATGLALLPIVVGGVRPGWEIEHPMAVVILGGLLTSTLLNLLLLPALYLRYAPPAGADEAGDVEVHGRGAGAPA
jgi:Cu/Ag efflux pump CusA